MEICAQRMRSPCWNACAGPGTAYVGGGWGVDALVGRQTRAHGDLDLSFDHDDAEHAIQALDAAGYRLARDERPVRLVLRDTAGHELDLHPVIFDDNGAGIQAAFVGFLYYPPGSFTEGSIGGLAVPCFSAALQFRFHGGYTPAAKDRHYIRLLRALNARHKPTWRRAVPYPSPHHARPLTRPHARARRRSRRT